MIKWLFTSSRLSNSKATRKSIAKHLEKTNNQHNNNKNSTLIELGYAYISAVSYLELAFLWAETSVSSCTQTEDDILNFINFSSTLLF